MENMKCGEVESVEKEWQMVKRSRNGGTKEWVGQWPKGAFEECFRE